MNAEWSLRAMLSPVLTRLLIHGVNAMDLEGVVSRIENAPLPNAKALEAIWLREWETLASQWDERARQALSDHHRLSAHLFRMHAATCHLARFLVNTSDLQTKRIVYLDYARSYHEAMSLCATPYESFEVPLGGGNSIYTAVHLPEGPGPHPVAMVLSGLGSCKEEMNTIARALVARGVAAVVPDLPGSGETLFSTYLACTREALDRSFTALADLVEAHPALDHHRLGATGLCMGGGHAYRATARDRRYRFCGTLFPLFIDKVPEGRTPRWMREGEWYAFQTGNAPPDEFIAGMGLGSDESVEVPFLLIHGRHDNWMTLEAAMELFDRVPEPLRKLLVIETPPVLTRGAATTHAMPVGEQMHWTVPVLADWVRDQVGPSE